MSADTSNPVRKWMKKEGIFDPDVEKVLCDQGIKDPTADFKSYTQSQWDDLYRRAVVERAKDLKDQNAKLNMEKKMVKLEKFWRKESGVKKTNIKPTSAAAADDAKAPPDQSSAAADNDLLDKAGELKKFLQKENCFNMDLLSVLSQHGVNKEADIGNIKTNFEWGQVEREFRVAQRKKLNDQAAKNRSDKTLKKFEKIWRAKTGVKSTSIKKGADDNKKKDAPKDVKNKQLATTGAALKKWMKKQGIWNLALHEELINNNIGDFDQLKSITGSTFDKIVRKVRVERFKDLKDPVAKKNADKLLVKFEKIWRKESGIKKTSIKKDKKKKKKDKPAAKPADAPAAATDPPAAAPADAAAAPAADDANK